MKKKWWWNTAPSSCTVKSPSKKKRATPLPFFVARLSGVRYLQANAPTYPFYSFITHERTLGSIYEPQNSQMIFSIWSQDLLRGDCANKFKPKKKDNRKVVLFCSLFHRMMQRHTTGSGNVFFLQAKPDFLMVREIQVLSIRQGEGLVGLIETKHNLI